MLRWMVAVTWLAAACGDDGGTAKPMDASVVDVPSCIPSGTAQTVYLNFGGATFAQGPDDAVANTSNIVDTTRVLAAWPHANSAAIKACMTTALASFNLDVVDVDPGAVAHHEIVFTTMHWDQSSIVSLSDTGCGTPPNPKSVSFLFANGTGSDTMAACEYATAQFAAASTGLDHSMDCHDALGTYPPACGPKMFLDTSVQCGEFQSHACLCTNMPTQNSFRRMALVHGRRCP